MQFYIVLSYFVLSVHRGREQATLLQEPVICPEAKPITLRCVLSVSTRPGYMMSGLMSSYCQLSITGSQE